MARTLYDHLFFPNLKPESVLREFEECSFLRDPTSIHDLDPLAAPRPFKFSQECSALPAHKDHGMSRLSHSMNIFSNILPLSSGAKKCDISEPNRWRKPVVVWRPTYFEIPAVSAVGVSPFHPATPQNKKRVASESENRGNADPRRREGETRSQVPIPRSPGIGSHTLQCALWKTSLLARRTFANHSISLQSLPLITGSCQ